MKKIIEYLKFSNYIFGKNDHIDKEYIFLEKIIKDNLLCVEIDFDSIKIQFNLIEQFYFESIEEIFFDFFKGNYILKYYMNKENILYSKLVWKDKKLKKYNVKVKYFHFCCKKISKIDIEKGVAW